MDIRRIEAGFVPQGYVLVYRYEEPIYEYDPGGPYADPNGGYISYYSETYSIVFNSGKLAPIEYFESGTMLAYGETTWGADEYGYFSIRNEGGAAAYEPDRDE